MRRRRPMAEREKGNFLHAVTSYVAIRLLFSGEFGTTASDLCQHVDQHFEVAGLYTFKQSMSLFVNWTLDDREQLLARIGDKGRHLPPIILSPLSSDPTGLLHAVQKARHIRRRRYHACRDLVPAKTLPPSSPQDAKNVVLLLGDVELAQQFVGSVRQLRGCA